METCKLLLDNKKLTRDIFNEMVTYEKEELDELVLDNCKIYEYYDKFIEECNKI